MDIIKIVLISQFLLICYHLSANFLFFFFLTPISNNITKVFIEHHIVQEGKGECQGFRHFWGQKSKEKAKWR